MTELSTKLVMISWQTVRHLELTFVSLLFAMLLSIPIGSCLAKIKNERFASFIIKLCAIIQTIPGLALIAMIVVLLSMLRSFVPVPTTGFLPAVIVLTSYALLPVMSNSYEGIKRIDFRKVEAAKALGMTKMQVFFKVEFPLALPYVLAGVRLALVSTVSMVTLTSLIGSGGLGDLIIQGLRTMNASMVLSGMIPAAILAMLLDTLLQKLRNYLLPRGLKVKHT